MSGPLDVRVCGPLVPFRDGFVEELGRSGYTPLSAANQVRLFAHVSRWMASGGLDVEALCEAEAELFLADRRAEGYTSFHSLRALEPLLGFLRSVGAIPERVVVGPVGPVEELVDGYRCWLVEERALTVSTVERRVRTAWLFLGSTGVDVDVLEAGDVHRFVGRECPERSVGTAKLLVSDTRSFLRFLFAAGWTSVDLSTAVPGVAGWRGAALPKAVASEMVAALLAGCDRTTVAGRRDYAVLVLLSRLGLRAGEVAGLCLEDIDWDAGEITVTGKGVRVERLPLPADVGEAIVGYLAHGRRPTTDRNVFLRLLAPHGPMTRGAVQGVVGQACERAGLERFGPHRLRHSAATDMLGAGAALAEVGQVLRHRSMSTTAIYAKCDLEALRSLAMVWPGGAR